MAVREVVYSVALMHEWRFGEGRWLLHHHLSVDRHQVRVQFENAEASPSASTSVEECLFRSRILEHHRINGFKSFAAGQQRPTRIDIRSAGCFGDRNANPARRRWLRSDRIIKVPTAPWLNHTGCPQIMPLGTIRFKPADLTAINDLASAFPVLKVARGPSAQSVASPMLVWTSGREHPKFFTHENSVGISALKPWVPCLPGYTP